jgi:hypothetical protein
LIGRHVVIEELIGLDLFHGRFAAHPHWDPAITPGAHFERSLKRLEYFCARDPAFIDYAADILTRARNFPLGAA